MIKLIRVDHRLIHGQVAVSWFGHLHANSILVANDSVPTDPIRKASLKMAVPAGGKLVMQSIDKSVESINSGKTDKYKLIIIVETIHDAYRLIQGMNEKPSSLNIGGTRDKTGNKKIARAVTVSKQDTVEMGQLINEGIQVEVQLVPSSSKQILTTKDLQQ